MRRERENFHQQPHDQLNVYLYHQYAVCIIFKGSITAPTMQGLVNQFSILKSQKQWEGWSPFVRIASERMIIALYNSILHNVKLITYIMNGIKELCQLIKPLPALPGTVWMFSDHLPQFFNIICPHFFKCSLTLQAILGNYQERMQIYINQCSVQILSKRGGDLLLQSHMLIVRKHDGVYFLYFLKTANFLHIVTQIFCRRHPSFFGKDYLQLNVGIMASRKTG